MIQSPSVSLSIVVAISDNNVIGKDNGLPWHVPKDLLFFKNITWGLPIILGRKTFESHDFKTLKGRKNIVLTRHAVIQTNRDLWVADSMASAIEQCKQAYYKQAFVIGGSCLFEEVLPIATYFYLSRIHTQAEGDVFFPPVDWSHWDLISKRKSFKDDLNPFDVTFECWRNSKVDDRKLNKL